MRTWFITGASRGFGLEIARQALENGDRVVATARDPEAVEKALPGHADALLAVALDVTSAAQAEAAVDAALARFGGIDVLVNNAGRGLVGAVEETSDREARTVFDTNVFGLLTVTRAVLPAMRAARAGTVLNVSSVGGYVGWAGWGVYCATKFAVEGLTEAMALELAPLGIRVSALEPGPLRTDFLDGSSLHRAAAVIDDYAETAGASRAWADSSNHAQPGDPVKAAEAVVTAVGGPSLPVRLPLGAVTVQDIEAKLAGTADILAAWRDVALFIDVEH
ncbi:oxidoreductase [Streptomyces wuyuanensis]|uniref:Short-chain dehydrogenase n=1 Tax=Streptomyces wuyuanensis TaxID=1196353 RepID=A0A1G9U206_9ACTN|nr:oxidoreductase [Streptomyces wuyuanensis]SDM53585.1 Short-chain dehydrogenase [Streptomyces wuyuanensis]